MQARELERGLLLACSAALRSGQSSLVGPNATFLRPPPRPFLAHLNSAPTPSLAESLRSGGAAITAQDEEAPVAIADEMARDLVAPRFGPGTESLDTYFSWGEREDFLLREIQAPIRDGTIVRSGGVRADFWRKDFAPYFSKAAEGVPETPFVLIASPFGLSLNSRFVWAYFKKMRHDYPEIQETLAETLDAMSTEYRALSMTVSAISELLSEFPEVVFVIRPHPVESWGAWEGLLGSHANLLVARTHSVAHWLHRAVSVVHFGETVGFEAALITRGRQVAFCPDGFGATRPAAQTGPILGTSTELRNHLLNALRNPVSSSFDESGFEPNVWNVDRNVPAHVVVTERWHELVGSGSWSKADERWLRDVRRLERKRFGRKSRLSLETIRRTASSDRPELKQYSEIVPQHHLHEPRLKFPALDERTVLGLGSRMQALNPQFRRVQISLVTPELIFVSPFK